MLYKKYQLYENKIEIMIPSDYAYNEDLLSLSDNSWRSKDKSVSIDVNLTKIKKGVDTELSMRLQDYYLGYKKNLDSFDCKKVSKRKIYDNSFGEINYTADVMGYSFYNSQMITILEDKELTVSIQCLNEKKQDFDHIFNIIKESVKVQKKEV